MLTKNTIIDQITIDENKTIFIRETTTILDDGVQISKTFHRTSLIPGSDLTGQDQSVIDIANLIWTQQAIDAYREKFNSGVNNYAN